MKLGKFKALAALTGVASFNLLTLPSLAQSSVHPPALTVIQGTITSIQGKTLTVKTPNLRPVCLPGQMCPQLIFVGPTFLVDISKATIESPSGRAILGTPTVGEKVIAAGQLKPQILPSPGTSTPVPENRTIEAQVIEQIESSLTAQ